MIVLYEVIPSPMGALGEYGRLSVDNYERWHDTGAAAESAAGSLRHYLDMEGRDLESPVIVVARHYKTVLDVVRNRPDSSTHLLTCWGYQARLACPGCDQEWQRRIIQDGILCPSSAAKLKIEAPELHAALSPDNAFSLEALVELGSRHPLSRAESKRLLTKVVDSLRAQAEKHGDQATLDNLSKPTGEIVDSILGSRE